MVMALVSTGVLIALCALVGGLAFEVWVLRADKAVTVREATQTLRLRWLRICALAVMVSSTLALVTGLPTWIWVIRLLMGGGVLLLLRHPRPAREQWPALLVGLLLLQTQSFVSRSAHLPSPIVPLLADWFHLTLAAIWLGGVGMLTVVILSIWRNPDRERMVALSAILARFSLLALFCVLGLAFSGIAQAGLFLKGFEDLLRTTYGITLSIKLLIFIGLIGFGAFHQQVIMPQLRRWLLSTKSVPSAMDTVAQLRWSLLLESSLGLVLLIVVGLLISFTP